MTLTAPPVRPAPPPRAAPAADQLRDALAAHARRAVLPPPVVATLGTRDVLGPEADPARGAARVHLTPGSVLIGPWPDPGAPGCGHCLGIRWQRLRGRTERDALETGTGLTAVGRWPVLPEFVVAAVWHLYQASLPAGESGGSGAVRPGAGDPHRGQLAAVSALDLASLRVRATSLLPDPRCPTCGVPEPDGRAEALVTLDSRPRPATGYRLRPASAYPLPMDALANPVCGALGAGTTINITSPTTAPVTGSGFIRGYGGLLDVSWSGQTNSYRASRQLAYLEGLERYAGTHRRRHHEPILASYREVAGEALDPAACGLYPAHVYARDPVVRPYSDTDRIPWVWGWSLRDSRPLLVPRRLCHYSSPIVNDAFVLSSSSGCATGSCLEEAALFGLLELVERDAFLIGWYGNAPLPRIDLDSCADPGIRAMVDRAVLQGYDILAFDNRIDISVPAVTSLAVRRDGGPGTLSFAAAAHVDPEAAIEAALSEALTYLPHQPRTAVRRRAELEAMADDYRLVERLPDHAALFGLPRMARHAESYVRPGEVVPVSEAYRHWRQRRPDSTDLRDDLLACVAEVTAAGSDVIVVDQTAPEQRPVGLRTVCVIAPGLVPIDFGWTRQRALYLPRVRTAQRRAGIRATDLSDADLRLVPHPFP